MQRCARCHLGISASEMVMRARDSVYHLSCFTCTTCNKTLTTGDHFGMKDSLVYCRLHFETLVQGPDYHPQLNFAELAAKGGGLTLPYFNGTGTAQKGRPRKRKSPAMGIDIPSYNTGETARCSERGLAPRTHKHLQTNISQQFVCFFSFFLVSFGAKVSVIFNPLYCMDRPNSGDGESCSKNTLSFTQLQSAL